MRLHRKSTGGMQRKVGPGWQKAAQTGPDDGGRWAVAA